MIRHIEQINGQEINFGFFNGDKKSPEYQYYQRAIDRAANIDSQRLSLEHSGKLTEAGIKDALGAKYVDLADATDRDIREIERQLAEATERADTLALSGVEKIEPGDTVAYLADQELRSLWRSLDSDTQANLHNEMHQGKHPDLAHALLRGSNLLSGMIPKRRVLLQDALLRPEQRHQMNLTKERIERLNAVKTALLASNRAMQMRTGLLPSEARKVRGLPSMTEEVLIKHGRTLNKD